MTFGFSTLVDLLSWIVAGLLGLKLAATVILLRRDRQRWFETVGGAALWWSTKVTPLLAVPCMIVIARLRHAEAESWIYAGLMVFVVVAVPIVIWKRFRQRPARAEVAE